LPKWTAVASLGDSLVSESGTVVTVAGSVAATNVYSKDTLPGLYLWEIPAAADQRNWRFVAAASQLWLQSLTDAGVVVENALVAARNGDLTLAPLRLLNTGRVKIAPAVAGNGLTINGYASSFSQVIIGGNPGHGLYVAAGVAATDYMFVVTNRAESRQAIFVTGDSVVQIGWRLVIPVGTDMWAPTGTMTYLDYGTPN
jgi:hypothetical protein